MKKRYTKISDLVKEDIKYKDENLISALDIVNVYLKGFDNCLFNLKTYRESKNIKKEFGDNFNATYYYDGKNIVVNVINMSTKDNISLEYQYTTLGDIKLVNYNNPTNINIEQINTCILPELREFCVQYVSLMKSYDCSHNAMYSVNTKFSLYLVDNEVIIFPGNYSYFSISLNEEKELNIDCRNTDILVKMGLIGYQEKILGNVYYKIEDAPLFIRDELYRLRRDNLEKEGMIPKNNQVLKRKINWLKK